MDPLTVTCDQIVDYFAGQFAQLLSASVAPGTPQASGVARTLPLGAGDELQILVQETSRRDGHRIELRRITGKTTRSASVEFHAASEPALDLQKWTEIHRGKITDRWGINRFLRRQPFDRAFVDEQVLACSTLEGMSAAERSLMEEVRLLLKSGWANRPGVAVDQLPAISLGTGDFVSERTIRVAAAHGTALSLHVKPIRPGQAIEIGPFIPDWVGARGSKAVTATLEVPHLEIPKGFGSLDEYLAFLKAGLEKAAGDLKLVVRGGKTALDWGIAVMTQRAFLIPLFLTASAALCVFANSSEASNL